MSSAMSSVLPCGDYYWPKPCHCCCPPQFPTFLPLPEVPKATSLHDDVVALVARIGAEHPAVSKVVYEFGGVRVEFEREGTRFRATVTG